MSCGARRSTARSAMIARGAGQAKVCLAPWSVIDAPYAE